MKKEAVVLSVGGSIVVPDEIDRDFLKRFISMVNSSNYKFVIVIGGGRTARKYQAAGKELGFSQEDLDWIGIHATWLNAELVRNAFGKNAYDKTIIEPTKKVSFDKVLVAGGYKPGNSTDYVAVKLAEIYDAKTVINMSNIDFLYDKDPNKFKDAIKIKEIDWNGFKKIVGDEWKPGMNTPFDPVATKKAASLGIKLILLGKDIENLKKFLDGNEFKGSMVEN